jgi:hypothetical protein
MPGVVHGIGIAGSYAYVAGGLAGLRAVDVSTPSVPGEVGAYDTPGEALDVAVAGSYAYVADYSGGLSILRFQPPKRVYLPQVLREE